MTESEFSENETVTEDMPEMMRSRCLCMQMNRTQNLLTKIKI